MDTDDEKDVWDYKSLRRKRRSAESAEISPRKLRHGVGKGKSQTTKSTQNKPRSRRSAPANLKPPKLSPRSESVTSLKQKAAGFCPMCQIPLCLLVLESPTTHITQCVDESLSGAKECTLGASCESMKPQHYRQFKHTALAVSRAEEDQRPVTMVTEDHVRSEQGMFGPGTNSALYQCEVEIQNQRDVVTVYEGSTEDSPVGELVVSGQPEKGDAVLSSVSSVSKDCGGSISASKKCSSYTSNSKRSTGHPSTSNSGKNNSSNKLAEMLCKKSGSAKKQLKKHLDFDGNSSPEILIIEDEDSNMALELKQNVESQGDTNGDSGSTTKKMDSEENLSPEIYLIDDDTNVASNHVPCEEADSVDDLEEFFDNDRDISDMLADALGSESDIDRSDKDDMKGGNNDNYSNDKIENNNGNDPESEPFDADGDPATLLGFRQHSNFPGPENLSLNTPEIKDKSDHMVREPVCSNSGVLPTGTQKLQDECAPFDDGKGERTFGASKKAGEITETSLSAFNMDQWDDSDVEFLSVSQPFPKRKSLGKRRSVCQRRSPSPSPERTITSARKQASLLSFFQPKGSSLQLKTVTNKNTDNTGKKTAESKPTAAKTRGRNVNNKKSVKSGIEAKSIPTITKNSVENLSSGSNVDSNIATESKSSEEAEAMGDTNNNRTKTDKTDPSTVDPSTAATKSRGKNAAETKAAGKAKAPVKSGLNSGQSSSSSGYGGRKAPRPCPFYKKIPGTGFTVDAFCYGSVPDCSVYFLSHFHYDHYRGLAKSFRHPIYCSKITGNLVRSKLYVLPEYINTIPLDTPTEIEGVEVTFMEANHCPGSVLILFKLKNGTNLLHTGDFRAHRSMEEYSPLIDNKIHTLYLDTTYCDPAYAFAEQQEVIDLAVSMTLDVMTKNPKTLVVCGSYTIGKERVFTAIAKALGCKIAVTRDKKKVLDCLEDPYLNETVTLTWSEAGVHVLPMRSLNMKMLHEHLNNNPQFEGILAFEPTGWSHSNRVPSLHHIKPKASRNGVTVYGIPYSEHSSFLELKRFVQFVKADKILPTVNNGNPTTRKKMEAVFKEWMEELSTPGKQKRTPRQKTLNGFLRLSQQ